nr:unnamed protein product [Digitaria exilis]
MGVAPGPRCLAQLDRERRIEQRPCACCCGLGPHLLSSPLTLWHVSLNLGDDDHGRAQQRKGWWRGRGAGSLGATAASTASRSSHGTFEPGEE